jgi:hypothetical protein
MTRPGHLRSMGGDGNLVGARMRRFGEATNRQEKQGCKRQEGRYGGVQTHYDFGGAERQSISYLRDQL